ncbi:hypothetical protein [Rubrivivax sp. JA1026]|uniref:hypothetical protein n=1 Tax=Rubrivivax sp. JA1026 TaxID=2710888 RepID=UPI0013E99B0A|nr:hypothetical protein [Rubrivivax sp. JA1026]
MKKAILALALVCIEASAQVPAVPSNVTSVQTIGYWRHDGQSGTYRVITTREGWEHVWSRVFIEWLPEPASRDATPTPSQSVELLPRDPGTSVIDATARRTKSDAIEVRLVARSNQMTGARAEVFRFLATDPGVVKPVGAVPR